MNTYSVVPKSSDSVRIGVGAGFAGDRLQPAELLANHGNLDALVFECLAERTIALAQQNKANGKSQGFDQKLIERLRGTLPGLLAGGGLAVTNGGAANPVGAALAVAAATQDLTKRPIAVAAVTGDDVLAELDIDASMVLETGESLAKYRDRIVSANAYLGASGVIEAAATGADVIITGRTSDAALFSGALSAKLGWSIEDRANQATGILVGHLLECAGQLTGGYFADGVNKNVPKLWDLGFPMADVSASGNVTLHKLLGSGGLLNRQTVLEQLLYEVENPHRYITPDLSVDFSNVAITDHGSDSVAVSGATFVSVPATLKVSVGIRDGYAATGSIVYGGSRSIERATIAANIVRDRWVAVYGRPSEDVDCHFVGINSTFPWTTEIPDSAPEVMLKFSLRTFEERVAIEFCREIEALYTNGPAGGGGANASYTETIGILSTLIPRDAVEQKVQVFK